ncbi:hypothetical protein GCM10010168_02440 [Actinoplanes ianthinogenes]|nr:hypothetical protein GCM10010168_02440 [Actinoplanes ianthinogenes]
MPPYVTNYARTVRQPAGPREVDIWLRFQHFRYGRSALSVKCPRMPGSGLGVGRECDVTSRPGVGRHGCDQAGLAMSAVLVRSWAGRHAGRGKKPDGVRMPWTGRS